VLTALARYPSDPGVVGLVAELHALSPDLERLWQAGGSAPWHSHRKTIEHPSLGRLTLDCDSLRLPDPDQTVIMYSG